MRVNQISKSGDSKVSPFFFAFSCNITEAEDAEFYIIEIFAKGRNVIFIG